MTDNTGQIIDLSEEKIYELDLQRKTYEVTTFAEVRRQMEEAMAKAREDAARGESRDEKEDGASQAPADERQAEIDFDVKETGQKKTIAGHDAREVVMTITVREKGKTLDESGGVVLTTHSWLGPEIPGLAEVREFDQRYVAKLQGPLTAGASVDQMAMAAALYPFLKPALDKLRAENVKLEGSPLASTMTFEGVKSKAQMAERQEEERPTGVGGLIGGLGRRMRKKKEDQAAKGPENRTTIFTVTHEVLSVTPSAEPSDVAVPEGFKEKS